MATSALSLVGAGPVSATHDADHTAVEIAEVVTRAGHDSNAIGADLAGDISKMSDEGAVGDATDAALSAVDSVWSAARTTVDTLTALYPGDLGLIGGEAKRQLQETRLAARTIISELANDWTPPAPLTTTTSTTTTTTTMPVASPPPGSEAGNPPEPETGGVAMPVPDPSPPIVATEPLTGPGLDLELAALTPGQPFTVSQEAISSLLANADTGATARMAAMLDTVLPPAVVDLVLSPLLVIEILIRTLIDGGSKLAGPLALFAISAMALFVYDRFSKRNVDFESIPPHF